MDSRQWREQVYQEAFEAVCADLQRRRATDEAFTTERLQGLLDSLYVSQGNDWTGKGLVQYLRLSATVAAHEHVLAEWRQERADGGGGA